MPFSFDFKKKSPAPAKPAPLTEDFRLSELVDPGPETRTPRPAPKTVAVDRATGELQGAQPGWIDRLIARPLPFIGDRPLQTQVQVLGILLGLSLFVVLALMLIDKRLADNGTLQVEIVGDTLMHTQRMAKAAPYALEGNQASFAELRESRDTIAANLDALANGDPVRGLSQSSPESQELLAKLTERWRASESAASVIIANEKALTAFGTVVGRINEATPRLQALTDDINAARLAGREGQVASQLAVLTQRIGRNANALVSGNVASAEAGLQLGRDTNQFRELVQALLAGSEALRVPAVADPEVRGRLGELLKFYNEFQKQVGAALPGLQQVVQSKEAELAILRDAEGLRQGVAQLQSVFQREQSSRKVLIAFIVFFGLTSLVAMFAIFKVMLGDSRTRTAEAESQRAQAERLEQEAKRANEQNQAAILRLMNELQEVADGNLTVQATVSEDITGAIADSVNYTVEELRALVGRINNTAEQVNTASSQARDIATRLLAAAEAQALETKETGEKVLRMASQIDDVSKSAGESAKVARTSLSAAERGQTAVHDQIEGMNEIREQIQETAKRIKRLGESSQEIGEIVELITDITEQTNVLALNAAIQAASAGEAGRGFSVVAEEVQRLADRSAEAAKQIGALVRTIQTDTQDAVAAMEKSTQGVVEGAKLSDAAGTALTDIGNVSRQLAELIERIAHSTSDQAQNAGGVAKSIERILSVSDQTSSGTRQTAQSIGQLATLARELKASVARFRVG
ncbi:MAG TPA: methyl-accepting chemotaxis protein [Burkholderiaceae bacterium]|jgi:twitching motility protein PilJ|nr:methyl-accepting chemotaxis protein [Burkholderiaceae bacterium]